MASTDLKPRVLVLLASRNGEGCIQRQIESVLAQADVDVRLRVRDDGSSDATRDLVSALATRDSRVSLWPEHSATGSAGGNFFALIDSAEPTWFDYVAFCDQDDDWLPQKLQRATAALRSSGASGYSAATQAVWSDGRTKRLAQSGKVTGADYLFEGAGQGCTFVLDARIFEGLRQQLLRHGDARARLHYHDWALYALVRTAGARWYFDSEAAMRYHQHDANDTGARSSGAGIRRRVALIRVGWYRAQVRAIVELVLDANARDAAAAEWARQTDGASAASARMRMSRLLFVARNGRRRLSDRCIQIAAVALGYL